MNLNNNLSGIIAIAIQKEFPVEEAIGFYDAQLKRHVEDPYKNTLDYINSQSSRTTHNK